MCGQDVRWFNSKEHIHTCDKHADEVWAKMTKRHKKLIEAWSTNAMYLAQHQINARIDLVSGEIIEGSIEIDDPNWLTLKLNDFDMVIQRRHVMIITKGDQKEESSNFPW